MYCMYVCVYFCMCVCVYVCTCVCVYLYVYVYVYVDVDVDVDVYIYIYIHATRNSANCQVLAGMHHGAPKNILWNFAKKIKPQKPFVKGIWYHLKFQGSVHNKNDISIIFHLKSTEKGYFPIAMRDLQGNPVEPVWLSCFCATGCRCKEHRWGDGEKGSMIVGWFGYVWLILMVVLMVVLLVIDQLSINHHYQQ